MTRRGIQAFVLGLATLAIGCGGTGGTQAPPPVQPAATVALAGTVSGTSGALAFSGQPLLTSGALVTDQGNPATPASIKPGSVIQGTALKGSQGLQLQAADVRHVLEGPITSVDLTGSKLVVLGQTVQVDALTVIEQEVPGGTATSLTLADLKAGDVVKVDGSLNADGSIQASRIERIPASVNPGSFLRGVVSALDATAKTFHVGGVTVSYGAATVTGTLANGADVVVFGSVSGSTLTATRVVVRTSDDPPGTVEVTGTVSALDATAKTFMLMSYLVDYSKAAVKGTLANGARVEAEGTVSTTGTTSTLAASEVEVSFSHSGSGASNREKVGVVTALNPTDKTLTLGSDTYWTDGSTVFLKAGAPASFADLTVGAKVAVHVLTTKTNAAGQAYATRVELLHM